MMPKRFLVPVGAAVAALLPLKIQAAPNPPSSELSTSGTPSISPSVNPTPTDPIVQELTYAIQSEIHALLLRQSSAGALYAGHGSHRSHASHHSHSSHRSGY